MNELNKFRFYYYKLEYLLNHMSNKIKTASSLSADSTEVRYQKALKEITKLIGLNTELRDEVNKQQQCIIALHEQLQKQQQQLDKITQHKNKLETELNELTTTKNSISNENEELKKEINRLKGLKNGQQFALRKKQTIDSYCEGQKGSDFLRLFTQLQKVLQQRDETIKELRAKLKFMEESSRDFGYGKIMNSETIKTDFSNNNLTKKLQTANEYINKLNSECADLKNRLVKVQSKNILMTARSMEALPKFNKYSPQISPRNHPSLNGQPTNSAEVLKRYHKLEQQNKKLFKKCQQYHHDLQSLKIEKSKLRKEHDRSGLQIAKYEQLIIKQQNIISKLHSDFDEEVQKMTNQFKAKLLQQRQSFSPGKAAQNLKAIENLQSQNKQLKKKFHLCSIQLTKCFKTLQVYKTKLSQCEYDYEQLANQKEMLQQKLNHLQVNPRDFREKSCHSRGSMTKLAEGDRRNSMGETGKFTYV